MTSQIKESWSLLCQLCICHNIIIICDSIYRPNKCMAYDGKRVFTEHSYVQNNLYELFLRKLHSSNKIFKKLLKTRPWDHWWTNISQPVLPDTIPEIHKCRHMLERGCWVCWGHHLGATLSSVSVMVSFPCIQLISICSEALGWSIGTIWPASWTYVLWHGTNLIKSEYEVTNTLWERERERERETLRKVRGPWLFSNPASASSTTNGTVGDAPNCFCPDHSMAWSHLEFPAER